MRKIAAVVIVALFAILLVACNSRQYLALSGRVSAIERQKYAAYTDTCRITVTEGSKEDPFIADGQVGTAKTYVRAEVVPAKLGLITRTHTIVAGGKEYSLARNGNRYSLAVMLDEVPADLSLKLVVDGEETTVTLVPLNRDALDEDKILRAVWSEFGDILKDNTESKEVVIRIVEDKEAADGYNVYAGVLGSTAVYNAVLLSSSYKVVSKI